MEVFDAVFHGDGPRRFGRGIAVPAAETADDPGGSGKTVWRMRVPEPFTLGLEISVESSERCDSVGIEGKPGGLVTTAVAGLKELDCDDRRLGSNRNQLEEPVGGSDLAVFEPEALGLENAEELLDQPAPLVPFDDTPCLFCSRQ
jgi:hypothetical protein